MDPSLIHSSVNPAVLWEGLSRFISVNQDIHLQTTVSIPVDGQIQEVAVAGCFIFDACIPSGNFHVNDRVFAANLEVEPVKFKAEVEFV
jgi:hypothetical protein